MFEEEPQNKESEKHFHQIHNRRITRGRVPYADEQQRVERHTDEERREDHVAPRRMCVHLMPCALVREHSCKEDRGKERSNACRKERSQAGKAKNGDDWK